MARNRQETPTAVELEILAVLWQRGASTVREIMEQLDEEKPRAYTSVLTMLNVMLEKGLVDREPDGRAHRYRASQPQEATLAEIAQDVLARAFSGSASSLISHALAKAKPTASELEAIQQVIDEYKEQSS